MRIGFSITRLTDSRALPRAYESPVDDDLLQPAGHGQRPAPRSRFGWPAQRALSPAL